MKAQKLKDGDALPFTFDVNFAAPKPVKSQAEIEAEKIPTIPLSDHEAALLQAEIRGRQKGIAEANASDGRRLLQETERVAAAAEKILAAIDQDRSALEAEAADLAVAIGRKLAGEALKRFPLDDIEALVSECLGPLRKTPHLVVRLNEKDAGAITETIGKLTREHGFEGRFIVLGEPDFKPGDCRIEWADGGIVRDRERAEAEILKYFKAYFAPLEGGLAERDLDKADEEDPSEALALETEDKPSSDPTTVDDTPLDRNGDAA
ncbi:MAG: FliH/SctL family protein [Pseudomonadota bacterium]